MKKLIFAIALAGATVLGTQQAHANEAVDMVVDKMAEGSVSTICGGGRESISAAAKAAVTALAQAGQISGDFASIGQQAGKAFYETHCG